jgi:hypothetical protein
MSFYIIKNLLWPKHRTTARKTSDQGKYGVLITRIFQHTRIKLKAFHMIARGIAPSGKDECDAFRITVGQKRYNSILSGEVVENVVGDRR